MICKVDGVLNFFPIFLSVSSGWWRRLFPLTICWCCPGNPYHVWSTCPWPFVSFGRGHSALWTRARNPWSTWGIFWAWSRPLRRARILVYTSVAVPSNSRWKWWRSWVFSGWRGWHYAQTSQILCCWFGFAWRWEPLWCHRIAHSKHGNPQNPFRGVGRLLFVPAFPCSHPIYSDFVWFDSGALSDTSKDLKLFLGVASCGSCRTNPRSDRFCREASTTKWVAILAPTLHSG